MRILLSNFLEDQFERVVGALDEERKASLGTLVFLTATSDLLEDRPEAHMS